VLATLLIASVSLWPFGSSQTSTDNYRVPAWNIRVVSDKFTGAKKCLVFQGKRHKPLVSYDHGAVAFQFARKLNTTKAAFQIDGGPVRAWDDVYPALVQTGAQLEGRSLANPTGGKVIIPLSALKAAHVVVIRPTPKSRPQSFAIQGMGDMIASAQGLGCNSTARTAG